MTQDELISFDQRETTVLIDVLQWARETEDSDYEGTVPVMDDETLSVAIVQLEEENTLDPNHLPPNELDEIMRSYADVLQEKAWDIDDSTSVLEFYETTFQTIGETIQTPT